MLYNKCIINVKREVNSYKEGNIASSCPLPKGGGKGERRERLINRTPVTKRGPYDGQNIRARV